MATECKYFSFIKDVKTITTIVLLELNGDLKGYCPFYGNPYGKIKSYANQLTAAVYLTPAVVIYLVFNVS